MVKRRQRIEEDGGKFTPEQDVESETEVENGKDEIDQEIEKPEKERQEKEKIFSNPVEAYEVKTYEVNARNKLDAEKALRMLLQSQDKIRKITPKRGTIYEGEVLVFAMRDW